jgi:hypothetical protein
MKLNSEIFLPVRNRVNRPTYYHDKDNVKKIMIKIGLRRKSILIIMSYYLCDIS